MSEQERNTEDLNAEEISSDPSEKLASRSSLAPRSRKPVDRYQIYPTIPFRKRHSTGGLHKQKKTDTPSKRKRSHSTKLDTPSSPSSHTKRRRSLDSLESGVGSSLSKDDHIVSSTSEQKTGKAAETGKSTESELATTEIDSTSKPVEVCAIPIGRLVWAKFTAKCHPWPGVTILGESAAQDPAAENHMWVFWFGDHQVSEVPVSRIECIGTAFSQGYVKIGRTGFKRAVKEALEDVAELLEKNLTDMDYESIVCWAKEELVDKHITDGKLTSRTEDILRDIRRRIEEAESESSEEEVTTNTQTNDQTKKIVKSQDKKWIRERLDQVEDVETVCLSCESPTDQSEIAKKHPLFKGGVCNECIDWIRESLFSFGADGAMSFCVICGNGGELLVCDEHVCGRTYCKPCLEILGSEDLMSHVDKCDPWKCLVCDISQSSSDLGMLRLRDDWAANIISWYTQDSVLHKPPSINGRPKIRVLSLFDGIGTAKVVLDNLNFDIEVFYCSEIEEDAIQVVQMNHPSAVHLGDVRHITEQVLDSLGRIDLLVGGSPCNDLALVNPARKGIYDENGTGILFFDFYRILLSLNAKQPDHRPFWLFENVVHMNVETKRTISRFLECEPAKLDAGFFSAQSRARYFWGNIPGMYTPVSSDISSGVTLQDCLSRGREAVVTKIRTVTTRGASLLQGRNEDTHAVIMNGQSDKLWPTELEKIFGLPVHYTDVGNLAPGKRQKLLGRSWCVPVIMYLLKPLTHIFATKV